MPNQNHELPGAETLPEGFGTTLLGGVFRRGGVATDDRGWLRALLEAEAGLARAVERAGLAPPGSGDAVTRAAVADSFSAAEAADVARASELTGNPVPGIARVLARRVPPFAEAAVHAGATSQDIMDTAAMLLASRALDATRRDVAVAADAAAALAAAHRDTLMVGRTLLQQAVPTVFGLVAAGWLAGLDSAAADLERVRRERLAVQFGGAAGTLASLGADGPRVASLLAEELGLAAPALPWHTERLRVIDVAVAMARVTAVLGKIARDVTLLAQAEVGEVTEGAGDSRAGDGRAGDNSKRPPTASDSGRAGDSSRAGDGGGGDSRAGDSRGSDGRGGDGRGGDGRAGDRRGGDNSKRPPSAAAPGAVPVPSVPVPSVPAAGAGVRRGGSSAMPNKRNPVASIAILGCARQVPGLLATLVASAEQEHQRAAGAWHAEWQPFSDVLGLAGSAAAWGADLLGGLVVDAARMTANLAATGGLPLAEQVSDLLAGALGGPQAHDFVARAAARAVASGLPLRDVLLASPEVERAGVTPAQVDAALDPAGYLGAARQFIDAALSNHR